VVRTLGTYSLRLVADALAFGVCAAFGYFFGWAGPALMLLYVVARIWVPIIAEFRRIPFENLTQRVAEIERQRRIGMPTNNRGVDPRQRTDKSLLKFLNFALICPSVFVVVGLPMFLMIYVHGWACWSLLPYQLIDFAVLPIHVFVATLEEKYQLPLGPEFKCALGQSMFLSTAVFLGLVEKLSFRTRGILLINPC